MIESKYGLKYSMPHSVVHIIDNSQYVGDLPTVIAEDPSMFSAIVVTGCPMGIDNQIVTITREDVLNAAFMRNLSQDDISKYGQTVTYANSLLQQGAPVRFMRVTPEDSTYAISCLLVQWRPDETDNKMHVRFLKVDEFPVEIKLDRFKNIKRLNATLMKHFRTNYITDANGYNWKQRLLMTFVSAGRGSVYNNMANAINPTQQSKRPANIQYEFVTIDTRSNTTVERFYASLININNGNRTDAIDSVNVIVGKRLEGSSIMVPTVNEEAVREVYNDWLDFYDMTVDKMTIVSEHISKVRKAINVNTFDLMYGHYIYDGTESDVNLPFYQVDMISTSTPQLPSDHRIIVKKSKFEEDNPGAFDDVNPISPINPPEALRDGLLNSTYGVSRTTDAVGNKIIDSVHVGDIYLTASNNSAKNPYLTIVGGINQYSGAVTQVIIPKVYGLIKKSDSSDYVIDKSEERGTFNISAVFNDAADKTVGTGSTTLNNLVEKGVLVGDKDGNCDCVVAQITSDGGFKLWKLSHINTDENVTGDRYTLEVAYTLPQVYDALDWMSHTNGSTGVGNVIGKESTDAAYDRVGSVVIDTSDYNDSEDAIVFVNDYNHTKGSKDDRIEVKAATLKFGVCPSEVNITDDIIGSEYDVLVYDDSAYKNPNYKDETTTPTEPKELDYPQEYDVNKHRNIPIAIYRYIISGSQGSLYRTMYNPTIVPANYYENDHGLNMKSELGGIKAAWGSTGFFDDTSINSIEFKWRYSALLVKAYRGDIDPRIKSPVRVPAKYLFDGGTNTIVGQTILPYVSYPPIDIINASTIFTEDEKEDVMFDECLIANITDFEDIDVKQAMYDLMIHRCYMGIPESKRPVGPGSGLSLHLDAGVTDANTAALINTSFAKRFDNPNASWDIGGYVSVRDGLSYTFIKQIVDNLTTHCKRYSVNKPYVGKYTTITSNEFVSYFPDIDVTDWEERESIYNYGGNAWMIDVNNNLQRRSQRTLMRNAETSDLIQESNMRTLSQLTYLLQNKIDSYLLEYDDDGVLKTLENDCNNMFSNWIGDKVENLDITFYRDKNIDGGDIVVCECNVTFRGLILRVPIIVNVNRRQS